MSKLRTDREIMKQALDALKLIDEAMPFPVAKLTIKNLRERLAQPEQEPVSWEDVLGAIARGWTHDDNRHKTMDVQLAVAIAKEIQDMVIAPPQRKPLTDEEIMDLCRSLPTTQYTTAFARAIEAAHGIKENT